jgi:O-antigen ligase
VSTTTTEEPSDSSAELTDSSAPQESSWALTLVYVGLILFTIGYYNRPEDFLGARYLPFALVGGSLAIGAFLVHLASGGHIVRPRETIILLVLFCWVFLSIPFANWAGGSFEALRDKVAKVLLLTIVLANGITSVSRLRKLLIVQVISVAIVGWMASYDVDTSGRAAGNSRAFGNANDLAVLLCVSFPLLFYLLLEAKTHFKKAFFAIALALVLYTVTLTYSRTGVLALIAAVAVLTWHFGIKTGRHAAVIVLGIALAVAFLALAPSGYGTMIASIFSNDVDVSGTVRRDAAESSAARQQLFNRAVEVTVANPMFGVGLNGFGDLTATGHVQHNTYLQYSSEAGIPALLLFLLLIRYTFVNLRGAERLSRQGSEVWRLAGALRASLWAFLVGAFFTNFGYEFFGFFIFGFAAALHQIALKHPSAAQTDLESSVSTETSD